MTPEHTGTANEAIALLGDQGFHSFSLVSPEDTCDGTWHCTLYRYNGQDGGAPFGFGCGYTATEAAEKAISHRRELLEGEMV